MLESEQWQAVVDRDATLDGTFVYAVRTTGVYCRPSCAARRPRRENVSFYPGPAEAERAGYRPCRRCRPDGGAHPPPHLALVGQVCDYLSQPHDGLPTLAALGERFHMSPYHLQRTFHALVGVTPRQYAAARRDERLRARLQAGAAASDAVYEAGYSSASRVYDRNANPLGMAPGRYRSGGQDAQIAYSTVPCPLGWLAVAATERGVCAVRLGDSEEELERSLYEEYRAATLVRDDSGLGAMVQPVLAYLRGEEPHVDLPVDVRATAFQQRVWQALRSIPAGETRSYAAVAEAIGNPRAVRAVARACATNPVALIVPCHRVIRQDGHLGGYRWGLERKRSLLDLEVRGAEDPSGEPREACDDVG